MSFRSALARPDSPLQPAYVRREPAPGREAVFRFSVPVLRVADVAATVAWYRCHLGFAAEAFPERAPHEFAIIERDGVQLLLRQAPAGSTRPEMDEHAGWDLYIWVDGLDLAGLEASFAVSGAVVRSLSPLGATMAELEVRDPNGYVLCIGGPTQTSLTKPTRQPS